MSHRNQPPKMTKLELFRLVGRGSELQHAWQHTYMSLLELKKAIDSSEDTADPNESVEEGENDSASAVQKVWLKSQNSFR